MIDKKDILYKKDLPEFNEKDTDAFGKRLSDFYKKLGWDGESKLNPSKIIINEDDWTKRVKKEQDLYAKNVEDNHSGKKAVGYLWMINGPSGKKDVPKNKVYILKNWLVK